MPHTFIQSMGLFSLGSSQTLHQILLKSGLDFSHTDKPLAHYTG